MFASSRKPYTAVTVYIERLTGPDYEESDLSGIVDLIEVIRIQDLGPTEAARAIRKKLKYGNLHRQLRALTILDGLISNAGNRFQRTFADEPLLERLRILPTDPMVDDDVKAKCNTLFRQWAVAYKSSPGLAGIASLHKQLPTRSKASRVEKSKVLRENEREAARENPFAPEDDDNDSEPPVPEARRKSSISKPPLSTAPSSTSRRTSLASTPIYANSSSPSKKSKKTKRQKFELEKEKPQILQCIAQSSIASTNLLNVLKRVNREDMGAEGLSSNPEVMRHFEECKTLRRQILRYIQVIESEQWLGSLLSSNDELVKGLIAFEVLDKGAEDDSDSEPELSSPHERRSSKAAATVPVEGLSAMSLAGDGEAPPAKPPRPSQSTIPSGRMATPLAASYSPRAPAPPKEDSDDGFDDNDPFGDQHAIG